MADEGRELFILAMDLTNALIASNRNRRLFYKGGDDVRSLFRLRKNAIPTSLRPQQTESRRIHEERTFRIVQ